jgi:Stage II sporulation protein E (SpoIIE)
LSPERQADRFELLAAAGEVADGMLLIENTVARLLELVVPAFADVATLDSISPDGELRQVATAPADPGREFAAGAAEVILTGRAQLTPEVIVVPLAIAEKPPIGALSLAMAESGRTFAEGDLALAAELGRRAAIAVENARLYAERSEIATTLQQSLLPPDLPQIPGFRLASLYRAAGEHNEVGGDFYDAFEVPGGWMVVGDVAGRGAEAAALTSLSRYTFRTAGKLLGDPIAALEQLNAALRERPRLSLVSVCCVMLRAADRDATADLVLAGHPPAYHLRRASSRAVGVFAPFLGAYERGGWEAITIRLELGDQLVLYTDGVIDTVGQVERFGEERLANTLSDATGAADAVRRIEDALVTFAHGSQVDDTAVIAVERLPSGPAAGGGRARGDGVRVARN